MLDILKSAAKIVFVMVAVTACIAFIIGKLPVPEFMILAVSAFSFFFSHKGDVTQPYAGK